MAEKRTTSSGSEGGRSRAAEFASKLDASKSSAKVESGDADAGATSEAKQDETESEAGESQSAVTSGSATGDKPEPAASASRAAKPGKSDEGKSGVRAEATEVPVKIASVPETSEYVVTIDNKTGAVTRIEQFNASNAERRPLSPAGHASVAAQLGTVMESAGPASGAVPAMLNAPAFDILVARSTAASPALSELTRTAVESGLMNSAPERPAAPRSSGKGSAVPGSTAVLQAYYRGALDYLNALATGAANGR